MKCQLENHLNFNMIVTSFKNTPSRISRGCRGGIFNQKAIEYRFDVEQAIAELRNLLKSRKLFDDINLRASPL